MEKGKNMPEETENLGKKERDEENLSWQTEGTEIAPFIRQEQKALYTFQPDSHGRSHQKQEGSLESIQLDPQKTKSL